MVYFLPQGRGTTLFDFEHPADSGGEEQQDAKVVGTTKPRFLVASNVIENECETQPEKVAAVCGIKAVCVDEMWGYSCRCKDGYNAEVSNDPHSFCLDVNECLSAISPCAAEGSFCEDKDPPEKYKCSCIPGYDGDGKNCDLDGNHPCNKVETPCSELATCTPKPKINDTYQWSCACNANFTGNGTHCEEQGGALLAQADAALVQETCETKACDEESSSCIMVNDNPVCACKAGYFSPSGFGGTCLDIDYCASAEWNTCAPPPGGICVDGPDETIDCFCATGYYTPVGGIKGKDCYLLNVPSSVPTTTSSPTTGTPTIDPTSPPIQPQTPRTDPPVAPVPLTAAPVSEAEEQALVDELSAFPQNAYEEAFGVTTDPDQNPLIYEVVGVSEAIGIYAGVDDGNGAFNLEITEILVASVIVSSDILDDAEVTNEVTEFVMNSSYSGFIFRGAIIGPAATIEVVALAFTTAELQPNYQITIIYDPADTVNGITGPAESTNTRERGLSSSNRIPNKSRSLLRKGMAVLPHSNSNAPLPAAFRAFNEHGVFEKRRRRRLQSCDTGLSDIKCPPGSSKKIDGACVAVARAVFQIAVNAALGKYDAAIAVAEAAYAAYTIDANRRKIRNYAKSLAPCVIILILTGPLTYAACAARALAACLLKQAIGRLAAKAAREAAKAVAQLALDNAIELACLALQGAVKACVECEKEDCGNDSDCDSEEYPDPHFKTWNQEYYDFHGACDMIHVRNSLLELHIRTERFGRWSGVTHAALRIGSDTLEMQAGGVVLFNGVATTPGFIDSVYPVTQLGGSVTVTLSGAQTIQFRGYSTSILVRMDVHGSDFSDSAGMAGTWKSSGLLGRDGQTVYTNTTLFAMEWEVDSGRGDPILFSTPPEGKCADPRPAVPVDPTMEQMAQAACAFLQGTDNFDRCVFDILATDGDATWAENPAYTDPLVGTERCTDPNANDPDSESCASVGGQCVYRCDTSEHQCVPGLCNENIDLETVVDRRRGRRLNVVDGCSCAVPLDNSDNILLTCISVIDESNGGPSSAELESNWEQFRAEYPGRPFCLLQPEPNGKSDLKIPPAFEADVLATYATVTRDYGDTAPERITDWFDLCGLDLSKQLGIDKVAVFIDNSGSLRTSHVQASYDFFLGRLADEDVELVKGIENSSENWIIPFLTNF